MKYILAALSIFLWAFIEVQAQVEILEDETTASLLVKGKQLLQREAYSEAAWVFDSAVHRPYNQASTAALYLAGLAWYYADSAAAAHSRFEFLCREYPDSRYVGEARFHQAKLYLQDSLPRAQARGLFQLVRLVDTCSQSTLVREAQQCLRRFAFMEADSSVLVGLYARAVEPWRRFWLEALADRMIRGGELSPARDMYLQYLRGGGTPSDFLTRNLDPRQAKKYGPRTQVKIAVCLPLHLEDQFGPPDSLEIPRQSQLALEFYEGFKLAFEDTTSPSFRQFQLTVFDSRRDSLTTRQLMASLDALYPDIVIGDVYNPQSRLLSEWAEKTGTPQVIPFSPTADLVSDKSYTFLATPIAESHGARMAEFAIDSLHLRKVAIWTNQHANTDRLAQAFLETFERLGGSCILIPLDSSYGEAASEITGLVRSLKFQGVDGTYIPILNDEEMAGLILSQLGALQVPVKVMGGPHWGKRYSTIDWELKESLALHFSSSSLFDWQDSAYQQFMHQYLGVYGLPPSNFALQGYDLGRYLLHVLENYPFAGMSLASYIRQHPPYHGLHLDMDFRNQQSNQFVNIATFQEGKVVKRNATDIRPLELGTVRE